MNEQHGHNSIQQLTASPTTKNNVKNSLQCTHCNVETSQPASTSWSSSFYEHHNMMAPVNTQSTEMNRAVLKQQQQQQRKDGEICGRIIGENEERKQQQKNKLIKIIFENR